MPLVVSSLTGDASDVFDWILSLNPGNTQDLTTLLQMLREHYCGSLTFREQRNTIENLRQKPQEAVIDFLIRVGTSVSNLGKDWKDKLTDKELQSLQYEVSLNGVQEEIRHILDSEIAKNGGKLTPQQIARSFCSHLGGVCLSCRCFSFISFCNCARGLYYSGYALMSCDFWGML